MLICKIFAITAGLFTLTPSAMVATFDQVQLTSSVNVEEDYCYNLTVNVNGMEITAQGCGATPQDGLNELGSAVRLLATMRN